MYITLASSLRLLGGGGGGGGGGFPYIHVLLKDGVYVWEDMIQLSDIQ